MPDQPILVPTPASEWGAVAEDGFLVTLPSGHVAKIRRTLDLPILIKSGQIPNPLRNMLRKMMDGQVENLPAEVSTDLSGKAQEQLYDLLNDTTVRTMLDPKVSQPPRQMTGESWEDYTTRIDGWQPDPGTVSVFAIDTIDQMFLFGVAQGMAADLETFRSQSGGAMAAVQTSEGLVGAAVEPAGPEPRKRPKATKRTGAAKV